MKLYSTFLPRSFFKVLSCWQQLRLWLKWKWDLLSNSHVPLVSAVPGSYFWSVNTSLFSHCLRHNNFHQDSFAFAERKEIWSVLFHSLFSPFISQMPASKQMQRQVVVLGFIMMRKYTEDAVLCAALFPRRTSMWYKEIKQNYQLNRNIDVLNRWDLPRQALVTGNNTPYFLYFLEHNIYITVLSLHGPCGFRSHPLVLIGSLFQTCVSVIDEKKLTCPICSRV